MASPSHRYQRLLASRSCLLGGPNSASASTESTRGSLKQNGRHERMHLTLKIETCSPPRSTMGWQQRAFDRFRRVYNDERPHQALELATPGSLYAPSPRRYPEELPSLYYLLVTSIS